MTRKTPVDANRIAGARVLKTLDGKSLLSYLRRKYYDVPMAAEGEALVRAVGRRDVVIDLLRMIETYEVENAREPSDN